jgi:hypothetical protein
MRKTLYIIALAVVVFALLNQCNGEVKTVVKTETIVKWKTDTITQIKYDTVPEIVYINRIKKLTGRDSIVYRSVPDSTTIKANRYETQIVSGDATGDLQITVTGELLNVTGTITYPEKETITEITKTKNASGLFMYGSIPMNNLASPEVGLMYQFKNKVGIMTGVQYNNITNQPDFKIGFLIRL